MHHPPNLDNAQEPGHRRRPNLFIIGAMKSGTTSLHHYLNSHPAIFMCEPKEPQFFVDTPHRPKDLDWYLGLFASASEEQYLGESSTFYTMLPQSRGAAAKIHAFNPRSRLVYIMRDPVDRVISHYWHMVRQVEEWRPLGRVIEEDNAYLAVSDYAMQLQPYFNVFEREQIMTLTFEEMKADPLGAVNGIFRWMELPPIEALPLAERAFNARPDVLRAPRGAAVLQRVRRSQWWERIAPIFPAPVRRLGRRITEAQVRPEDHDLSHVIDRFRPVLAERVAELSKVLGREFPEWTTVLGGPHRVARGLESP